MRNLILQKINNLNDAHKISRYVSIPKDLDKLSDEDLLNLFTQVARYS